MKKQNDKIRQPDKDIQKNADALGNAKVSNNDPRSITHEERTRQYGEADSEYNRTDDRGTENANYRQDV